MKNGNYLTLWKGINSLLLEKKIINQMKAMTPFMNKQCVHMYIGQFLKSYISKCLLLGSWIMHFTSLLNLHTFLNCIYIYAYVCIHTRTLFYKKEIKSILEVRI